MKVIFNYATRQFEPMEPTLRDRFALGGRVNFDKGGIKITKEAFENLWKNFTGRNKEFADLLNEQGYVTARGKKFNYINVSEYVGYYGLERKPRGGKIFPTTQKKLDKLDQLIVEANNSYTKTPTIGELVKKSKFAQSGKISDISRDGPAQSLVREKLKKLLTTNQKMENYINNVMLSENALVKDFYAPSKHLTEKFNISSGTFTKFMKNSKAIANNKELFLNLGRIQSFNKYGFYPDGSSKTIREFSETIANRVPFSQGFGALREDNATSFILKSAVRNHFASKAVGKTPKVTFVTDPAITNAKDLQFIDNKSGKLFSVDPSIENVEFRGKTYKNNYLNNVNASKLYSKEFGNVYKMYDNDIPKYLNATVIGPNGNRVTLDSLLRIKNYERTGSKNFLIRRAVEVDHLNLIDDPFGAKEGNIRLIERITNIQAGGLKQAGDVARGKNPKLLKERLDAIGYNIKDKDVNALIKRLAKNYDDQIEPVLTEGSLKLAEKRKAFDPYFQKPPSQKPPIKIFDTLEIDGIKIKQQPSKIKTALKAAKPVLKALPIIGTGIGLYDVNKALKAGITDLRDLYTAYEVSADVAAKQKAIREDPTGKLLQEEISKLPDIGQELPDSNEVAGLLEESGSPYMQFLQGGGQLTPEEFNQLQSIPQSDRPITGELDLPEMDQTMMAAQGGRVGFKDGSPNPMEEMATLKQAIAATTGGNELKDQFLYDTSPIGKLDKNIFGKDGDRNLMQQFNTQFLDPRSYPYYAQKTLRGATNIPELAVRFPLAAAYLFGKGSLALQTGDLSKFSVKDLKTAMEILEPKFTKLALDGTLGDVFGLSPKAIQAVEEKRAPSQKATGDFLQFGAEAVGPATPYFAVKALQKIFPKLPQQIKDLVGSTTAIDKVNKEIEKRTAVEGVDQTRRDILLATGAGGAVALLKFLGLENLFKAAPKAAKVTEEIVTKGGTPKYFFDFVGLIKSKGKDITDKAATLERQKVYDYNGYELTEDISTGKITIRKDTEGGASYYIGDGEYETVEGIVRKEEINYEPPETILDDAGKPKEVPDQYDEATLKPDQDGSDGDVEGGLDSIDDILDLLAKDGKKYSLDELKEMGINPEGIGDDFLLRILKDPTELKIDKIRTKGDKKMDEIRKRITERSDKAGGGIMKMAGDDSGPPPKSGPTPHGLPYVAKNVRPIKERK